MRHRIRYAGSEGLKALLGAVLKENAAAVQMSVELAIEVKRDPDGSMLYAVTPGLKGEAAAKLLGCWMRPLSFPRGSKHRLGDVRQHATDAVGEEPYEEGESGRVGQREAVAAAIESAVD